MVVIVGYINLRIVHISQINKALRDVVLESLM